MKYRMLHLALLSAIIFYPMAVQSKDGDVELSGQIRVRSEVDGKDFNNDTSEKNMTFLRTRFNAAFQPAEKISTLIQLQDSRVHGSEPGTLADFHNVDLHQAYFQVDDFLIKKLTLKMGRMELSYGGQRLLGAVGWHNVARAFDTSVLRYKVNEKLTIDSIGAKVIHQGDAKNPDDTGFYFGGVYATYQPKKTYRLDFYGLAETNRKQTVQDENDLDRFTLGTYDKGKLNALDYEVEAAIQLGRRHNPDSGKRQDVSAFMLTGSVGYTLDMEQKPRVAVGYDYLSGQEAGDEDYKVFDTLFATNHKFYGFMDYFINIPVHTGGAGLQDLMAKFQITPHKKLTLKADVHQFMSAKDVNNENTYGQEVDVTAIYRYAKTLNFTLGVALFSPGELMEARFAGNSDVAFWSYLMTTASF